MDADIRQSPVCPPLCEFIASKLLHIAWMAAFASATQQRLRGGAAGFLAASARSENSILLLWAQSDHLLHYVLTSALENSGRSDTMRHGSRPGNTSLFALTNSLILGRNFPVKKFREIAPKSLFSLPRSRQQARIPAKPAVFPCTFPVYREFWCRLASSKLSAQPHT